MAKLHGCCLHNGIEEIRVLLAFDIGDALGLTSLGLVVVQQGHKGLVSRATESTTIDRGEEGIVRLVFFPVWLFASLDVDGVVSVGCQTIDIQVPQFLDSITQTDIQIEFRSQLECVFLGKKADTFKGVNDDIDATHERNILVLVVAKKVNCSLESSGSKRDQVSNRWCVSLKVFKEFLVLFVVNRQIFVDAANLGFGTFGVKVGISFRTLGNHASLFKAMNNGVNGTNQ
mmetsp:Transcript_3191/g.7476  ORF Transcript_3191/g.7476 Transcript_3191/m.7476 type:complete len:230 (+) Transcript_3191:630-1319(+)